MSPVGTIEELATVFLHHGVPINGLLALGVYRLCSTSEVTLMMMMGQRRAHLKLQELAPQVSLTWVPPPVRLLRSRGPLGSSMMVSFRIYVLMWISRSAFLPKRYGFLLLNWFPGITSQR